MLERRISAEQWIFYIRSCIASVVATGDFAFTLAVLGALRKKESTILTTANIKLI